MANKDSLEDQTANSEKAAATPRPVAEFDRLRSMFEQAPGFICLMSGPDLVVDYVNEAHRRLFGDYKAEGRRYLEAFADVSKAGNPQLVHTAYTTGERYVGRAEPVRVPRPGGVYEQRFIDVVVEPLKNEAGEVTAVFVEGFDVTPQVRAQQVAEENARRLSAAVAVARLGTFEWDGGADAVTFDERAREIYGFTPDQPLSMADVLGRLVPEEMPRVRAEADASQAGGRNRRAFEFRIRLPDGSIRHIAGVTDGVIKADGKTHRTIGVFDDVTERRRAEQRQQLLINELNHRVKNTLATVQSIASQTLRAAGDLANARASFEARLAALSAAHDLLTAQSWHGARLGDVAVSALAPFESVQRPQISRSGPSVWLAAPRALALSLALHELATNAAKYGALSVPDGEVSVQWGVCEDELVLTWSEHGGPPVAAPQRSGFGTRLLQRGLAKELHGQVALDFAPEGVRCEIRFRIEDLDGAASSEPARAGSSAMSGWLGAAEQQAAAHGG